MPELPKIYKASSFEDNIYAKWEESDYFNPDKLPNRNKKTFTISLPPPNVTGQLHLGHAAMLAYQDIMIRYHRLLGDKTLWLPGMDHAAIATQTVVEKKLNKEHKTRYDLGRDGFLKEVNDFAENSKKIIRNQLKKMGSSLDWSRECFTLDDDLSIAVKTVFKKMYDDGLIYRGNRVVNWCPHCQSTLADDEVEYVEKKAPFYYFKYGPVIIGTARPETKFCDKVIIVHPKDERYKDLIGKEFEVDWIEGKVKAKVIADITADMNMGSGAMTITPAHSLVDFELAQKYNLEVIQIIDKVGKLTSAAGPMAGLDVEKARIKVVEVLNKKGLVHEIDNNYIHNLSTCYRCNTPIEPLLSKQWFIDVNKKVPTRNKSLKQLASEIVESGEINIIPARFNKTYFQWIDNLRDWCISRQIWYGHRIPVWYKGDKTYVDHKPPKEKGWIQDEDTLDTWFSSSLWTFSTLGWPKETDDLKAFHPTTVVETGYDILFFWVARMIIMSTYVLEEKPFASIYLHGLIRDKEGKKMSKSLSNGIDPIEMIEKYGADALRLSIIIGSTPGNDTRLYEEKIEGYRNFVNKLWNISRYILTSVKEIKEIEEKDLKPDTMADYWILNELNRVIENTTNNLNEFKFSTAGEELYEFTWNKLANWYLEIAKIESQKDQILTYILEKLLILWHPMCPYITEVIWEQFKSQELLMIKKWPEPIKIKEKEIKEFNLIQGIISTIRNARAEHKANTKKTYSCTIATKNQKLINENKEIIESLAKVKITPKSPGLKLHFAKADIILDINENPEVKKNKEKSLTNLERYISIQEKKLSNKKFVKNAPKEIIFKEEEKLKQAKAELERLMN